VERVVDLALDHEVICLAERETLLLYRRRVRCSHVVEILAA